MPERMRPLDMTFLTRESTSTPMHVATLDIFEPPPDGFDYGRLVALIHDRLAFVPRYRQRVQLQALDELLGASSSTRERAPRGRVAKSAKKRTVPTITGEPAREPSSAKRATSRATRPPPEQP